MVILFSGLFFGLLLPSCKNGDKDTKITDIPATTSSAEALAAFKEGLSHSDAGDRLKANDAFSKAINLDPKFGMAYLLRANNSNSTKEFADDIAAGKSNIDSAASSWEQLYAELMQTRLSGDRDKAIQVVQKIATKYPDAARAQVYLGDEYTGDNKIDKARAAYEKAIQLDPKWAGGYAQLAGSYMFVEPLDLKKAEINAMKVVELAPQSAGANILSGDCYRAQNNLQKAKNAYEKAVSLDTKVPEAYYKLGHANTFLGNLDEARKNYADAGINDSKNSSPILFTAYTYLYADDAKSAETYIMGKLAGNSEMDANRKTGCLTTIAEIAMHNNDAATLKKAVEMMKPLSGQVISELGNGEEIMTFFKADSLHWQAMIEIAEGKYDLAKKNLEAMKTTLNPIKDNRKLEGYEYDLGVLEMNQKNFGNAINHFEISNLNIIYNKYMLAKANEAAGNADKANALYKEVAAYNFNDIGNALVRNEVKKKIQTP